jgi:outer membrane protein assembly factor BamE (lipoprotein component of BamABCDE complex)
MKRTLMLSLIVSAAVAGFCGCASDKGDQKPAEEKKAEKPKDTRPWTERLKVGMTQDEVRAELGNPNGKGVDSNGCDNWTYNDTARGFIPYYSLTGGKYHHLLVNFGKDGKVTSWSSSETGRY